MKQIKGISSDGSVKIYDVILTFNNEKNNKDYVVYTDNTYDSDNKLKVYAAIYDKHLEDPFIGYPANYEEWQDICELLDTVMIGDKK